MLKSKSLCAASGRVPSENDSKQSSYSRSGETRATSAAHLNVPCGPGSQALTSYMSRVGGRELKRAGKREAAH